MRPAGPAEKRVRPGFPLTFAYNLPYEHKVRPGQAAKKTGFLLSRRQPLRIFVGQTQRLLLNMWLTIILWAVATIYLCIVLSTVMVVVLENRQPVKTIAWTLVLVTLPVLGLVFFYFFGQNIRKDRIINRNAPGYHRRRQLAAAIHRSATGIPAHYAPVVHLFERLNMALPFGGNHIDLYTDGATFTLALLKAIGSARHHIHLQSYIIDDDCVGRLVADALIDKAREGVEVRLIYDDVGCWNVPARFFERLAQGGVEARSFLPVRFPSLTHKVNYRNHRKVCVVDGRVGFVGGMNLARRYVRGVGGAEWRDLHLRLTGPAVSGLQHTFLTDWFFVAHSLLADSAYYPLAEQPPAGEGDVVQIVTTDPGDRWPDIMYGLTWIIQNARRYLYIQTPYFMPTEPVLQALQTAALAGVDVRLMVPLKPDGFWLRWANDSYFTDVLSAGIRVFTYTPGFLHSKALVVDDSWSTVGSTNMDFRSFENNFEANAFIYGRASALRVKAVFEEDLAHCTEVFLDEWRRRPIRRRLLESFTRIFSPLL